MAVKDIIAYIEANKNRFSQETLLQELRKNSYPESEIQEALLSFQKSSTPIQPPTSINQGTGWKNIWAGVFGFLVAAIANAVVIVGGIILSLLIAFGEASVSPYLILLGVLIFFGAETLVFIKIRHRIPHFAIGFLIAGVIGPLLIGGFAIWYFVVVPRNLYQSGERGFSLGMEEARMKSRDARRIADIKQIQLALELHFDAEDARYPRSTAELSPMFIQSIPRDPSTGLEYSYRLTSEAGRGYYLSAELESVDHPALLSDKNPGNMLFEVGVEEQQGIEIPTSSGNTQNPFQNFNE